MIFSTTYYNNIQHLIEIPEYPPRLDPFEQQRLTRTTDNQFKKKINSELNKY